MSIAAMLRQPSNGSRLSCGAELKCSQTKVYHTGARRSLGSIERGRRQLQALVRRTPHRSTPVEDDHEQDNEQDCQNQGDHLTPRRTPVDPHGLVIGTKHALLIGNAALEKIADFGKEPDSRVVVQVTSMAGVPPNESRLSCGAPKKDSFHNLRAPPASSAC